MALKEAARKSRRDVSRTFSVPDSWKGPFEPAYRKLAKECGLPAEFREVGAAEQMVAGCVNAALDGSSEGRRWDASSLCWRDR
jgi:hypothetical protein